MRMPLATSTYASFWGVVTMTAAENATVWHLRCKSSCWPFSTTIFKWSTRLHALASPQ